MVVDIGGGTTEVAIISLFATAYCESIRVAGDELNEAIIYHLQKKHHLLIGENTAEQIKIDYASAYPLDEPIGFRFRKGSFFRHSQNDSINRPGPSGRDGRTDLGHRRCR